MKIIIFIFFTLILISKGSAQYPGPRWFHCEDGSFVLNTWVRPMSSQVMKSHLMDKNLWHFFRSVMEKLIALMDLTNEIVMTPLIYLLTLRSGVLQLAQLSQNRISTSTIIVGLKVEINWLQFFNRAYGYSTLPLELPRRSN